VFEDQNNRLKSRLVILHPVVYLGGVTNPRCQISAWWNTKHSNDFHHEFL